MVISNPPQVYPDRQVREKLKQLGAENLFYPDQRLTALGQQEDFAVLTLAKTMQQKADAEQIYWHGFDNTIPGVGHWNVQGHQLAGQLIGDRLCQMVTEQKSKTLSLSLSPAKVEHNWPGIWELKE
ncbi:SGNH/GDSL hydrolase family protein [Synechocystis sp. B12]|nr:SGNH/GDSL hydrolase family protein [Synechocystis sp. B12]